MCFQNLHLSQCQYKNLDTEEKLLDLKCVHLVVNTLLKEVVNTVNSWDALVIQIVILRKV